MTLAEPIKTIEEFVEAWKKHPEIDPENLNYDTCSLVISEGLMEGATFAEMKPFIRGLNLHFHGIADLELRK